MVGVTAKNLFSFYEVLDWFGITTERSDFQLTGIAIDSRLVEQGDLFCAIPGYGADGRLFISDAVNRGASLVLVDEAAGRSFSYNMNVPVLPIRHLRERLGDLLKYLSPLQYALDIFGVTGTNGKTSCCFYLAQYLHFISKSCALSSTIGNGVYPNLEPAERTTADVLSVHQFLNDSIAAGATNIAMEVSSHGLHQYRVSGVPFKTAIFTNLTQDHLDYHGSMYEYARAKSELFCCKTLEYAVINYDDSYSDFMQKKLGEHVQALTYSVTNVSADVFATEIKTSFDGITAILHSPWGTGKLDISLLGQFNLSNLLAVISALALNGYSFQDLLQYASQIKPVRGRMQCINYECPSDFGNTPKKWVVSKTTINSLPMVIVDYAHTPDALASVLLALRNHIQGRLICVFGCGGERDVAKRPLMAREAEVVADFVIVTNDNPRTENPAHIVSEIISGFSKEFDDKYKVIHNRSEAIKFAIKMADAEDCVLIAGKGHETYQLFADKKVFFCDASEVNCIFNEIIQ